MKYSNCERNMRDWSEWFPVFPYLKHLQAVEPSFVNITKTLSSKIGETFCEALKLMCKRFEIDQENFFWKPGILPKSSKHFTVKYAKGNL